MMYILWVFIFSGSPKHQMKDFNVFNHAFTDVEKCKEMIPVVKTSLEVKLENGDVVASYCLPLGNMSGAPL